MGLPTAAMANDHLNACRKPKSSEIIFSSYVLIIDQIVHSKQRKIIIIFRESFLVGIRRPMKLNNVIWKSC